MKPVNQILLLSLFLSAGCAHEQTVNPLPAVVASFETRFGKDAGAKWELSADGVYLANFMLSGHPVKSYFDENGGWIRTETELLSSELPSVIVQTVLGAYKGYTISKSLQVEEIEKETIYRLSLKRGDRITEVELTSGGVILGTPMMR
jgi:hypothetical protein